LSCARSYYGLIANTRLLHEITFLSQVSAPNDVCQNTLWRRGADRAWLKTASRAGPSKGFACRTRDKCRIAQLEAIRAALACGDTAVADERHHVELCAPYCIIGLVAQAQHRLGSPSAARSDYRRRWRFRSNTSPAPDPISHCLRGVLGRIARFPRQAQMSRLRRRKMRFPRLCRARPSVLTKPSWVSRVAWLTWNYANAPPRRFRAFCGKLDSGPKLD
jgi:hypothetical protein